MLRNRTISSSELLELHIRRMTRIDPLLNSIVVRDLERAKADAAMADRMRAGGDDRPLLGLPMTVKESIDIEGKATTAGVPERAGHRASADALTVRRLRQAGAVIFGKTNVCPWLADYIGDNPLFGRTNNPWDLSRTSGGSTAGSAALAAGLSPLELGSDLGGSIRVPAAFCGLWGHKPSEGLVPNTGHFPGSAVANPGAVLAVQGPHGRSAGDLAICLKILMGPDRGADAAWQVAPPSPRHSELSGYRVAVIDPPQWVPLDAEIRAKLTGWTEHLRSRCASVEVTDLGQVADLREYFFLFRSMMNALISSAWPTEKRQTAAAEKIATGDPLLAADARGLTASAQDYLQWLSRREEFRAAWREFFTKYDILLTPMTLVPAFSHPTVPPSRRRIRIDDRECGFDYLSFYPALATLAGQPATAFPAGFNKTGLPLGLQAIGPCLEDFTPLKFAERLAESFGGFQSPPLDAHF
ncbi:MAG TPA: amidase family protein [Tepidisphaeraceae bacterium]|nr:amidase family protein [Tepidisphaeraceae bacterium]